MIDIDGHSLTLEAFRDAVHGGGECRLQDDARQRMQAARDTVERATERGDPVYGVNTGFGDLAGVNIPAEKLRVLQRRLVLSHCAGIGDPLPDAAVRGMLLLRANTLAIGHSGARPLLVDALLTLLNSNVLPLIPSRGSVGASGDLAPLAHLAAVLLGEGEATVAGKRTSARKALRAAGLEPLTLQAKEGLALINGTQAMTSLLALAVIDATRLAKLADLIGAMATDALRGTDTAFDPRLHAVRPHPGQRASAANVWALLQGSQIRESHRSGDVRVQDPYSIRCIPQVHGAVRDIVADVARKAVIEMNAVTDNPLVFPEQDEILSGGNFHGEPMALGADILAIAIAELGTISERRIEKLTNTAFSGLPPFLIDDAGLNSGFMMAQVTAAALASENKTLCHPASVDSIPTSADKEDHVSMGMWAALKLHEVVRNTQRILAIELLCSAQGIDLLRPMRSSARLEALHEEFRQRIPTRVSDRELSKEIASAVEFVQQLVVPLAELH
jgi:histidine ammonia-lyase